MRKFGIALILAMTTPAAAYAAACDTPRNGFDNVYCFAKIYMDLDKQLNDNYIALMKLLTPEQKKTLRTGQLGWIADRDAKCYRSSENSNSVNIDCALGTTRSRIQFLSDRLAECRGTGCNLSKLGRVGEI
jgi:uncharacterized protein YecT (DUF1311 family)